jgi:hypothetical protein
MADGKPKQDAQKNGSQAQADDIDSHRTDAMTGLIRAQGGHSPENCDDQGYYFS